MRVLQVVHGYPPTEQAGTERYAYQVATGLTALGHAVHTLAATISPGRPMYSVLREPGLTRVVNNLPGREARTAGSDAEVDRIFEGVQQAFGPDVVLIQHLSGLSSTLPLAVPSVWMLHDAWGWCAAGGQLLRAGLPCAGPGPDCAACATSALVDTGRVGEAVRVAGRVGRIVPAELLHRLWRRGPAPLRRWVASGPKTSVTPAQVDARTAAFVALAGRSAVVAPSRYFAGLAMRQGFGSVTVLPHGVNPTARWVGGEDFVFIGTLAAHKGPHVVRAGWELAGRPGGLRIYGPPGPDPRFTVPNEGVLSHAQVQPTLCKARALVLGSLWPENAPMVVNEALAVGCPVIAPRIGGLPELVHEACLYTPGDVADLARVLSGFGGQRSAAPPTFDAHLSGLAEILWAARRSRAVTLL